MNGLNSSLSSRPFRVLVTGANGFLGRHIVECLHGDFQVRGMDVQPAQGREGDYVQASVTDKGKGAGALEGMDGLILAHMASRGGGVYGSVEIPFEINVKGTAQMLENAVQQGVRRVVLISSVGVVDRQTRENQFLTRDMPATPTSIYALTKALQEVVARYYHEQHGLEIACLRPAHIVEEDSRKDKYGGRCDPVSWRAIDPRDIATAAAAALRLPKLGFEIFHLLAGADADLHGDVAYTREVLGWRPKHDFLSAHRALQEAGNEEAR